MKKPEPLVTNRRSFLQSGLVILAGVGGVAACTSSGSASEGRTSSQPPIPDPQEAENYLLYPDLVYTESEPVGRAHLLDVYVPRDAAGPFPVLIHQMGSAFRADDSKGNPLRDLRHQIDSTPDTESDSRSDVDPDEASLLYGAKQLANLWAPKGYAVVGLNVRNSSQSKFPGQIHDAKAAIRYLRANAKTLGLDPNRFAMMGASSGGWVSLMVALTAGDPEFEGNLGNQNESSSIRSVIALSSPSDFLQMDAHRPPGGHLHEVPDSPESELMGFSIQTDPAAVEKANPARYVRSDSPPAFIAHGIGDLFVPYNQAELLFDAYVKARATANMTLIPNAGHTDSYLADPNYSTDCTLLYTRGGYTTTETGHAPTFDDLLSFLDKHLRY
ncbi:alpha/beta hydrolase [Mycobacterium sp. 141]|uniref:alpha/beta hydrolase n=1 Tax=Mycobacterium sp. 141 TaxID=1120797 RepID=UPI000381C0B7|nr:alpha/beta hydrolase [Mycobacterium sp. 141]